MPADLSADRPSGLIITLPADDSAIPSLFHAPRSLINQWSHYYCCEPRKVAAARRPWKAVGRRWLHWAAEVAWQLSDFYRFRFRLTWTESVPTKNGGVWRHADCGYCWGCATSWAARIPSNARSLGSELPASEKNLKIRIMVGFIFLQLLFEISVVLFGSKIVWKIGKFWKNLQRLPKIHEMNGWSWYLKDNSCSFLYIKFSNFE